jgi:hypothetical protein
MLPTHPAGNTQRGNESFAAFWRGFPQFAEDPFQDPLEKEYFPGSKNYLVSGAFVDRWSETRRDVFSALGNLSSEVPGEFVRDEFIFSSEKAQEFIGKFAEAEKETMARIWCHISGMTQYPKQWGIKFVHCFLNHFEGVNLLALMGNHSSYWTMAGPSDLGRYLKKPICPCNGTLVEGVEGIKAYSEVFRSAQDGVERL